IHQGESPVNARARQITRQQGDEDERANDGDEQIKQWNGEHFAGREKILPRIAIDHRQKKRSEYEKNAYDAEKNRAVREKKNFDQDENDSENKERNDFPASQAGQIMAEEKESETDC